MNCAPLTPLPRSPTWLLWELHGGLLPGWGSTYGRGRGAVLCAPDPPQAPARPGVTGGDVHNRPHAALHPTGGGAQELLQWRHPARLHWRGDTYLSRTVQRLHMFTYIRHWSCKWVDAYFFLYFFFLFFQGFSPPAPFFWSLDCPPLQPWTSRWLTFNYLTLLDSHCCVFSCGEKSMKGALWLHKPQRGRTEGTSA